MTLGYAPKQTDFFHSTTIYCNMHLSPTSIYRYLHDNCHNLFPDEAFADLYADIGRCSVPPRIVSVVMVLQRLEGLSDREAIERFMYDMRWKYAAGGLDFQHPGFVHTVLVDMRARLRVSGSPQRLFEVVLNVAKKAGIVGRKRALDSTPLYDAVATQDTVTMIRSAIRGLLRVASSELETQIRKVLKRDDDYISAGKPVCDWDDSEAREQLIDALANDAFAILAILDGLELSQEVNEAASLLATVVGQDIEKTDDGKFRIARRVAKDRVISTVDPEARHGHKSSAHGFDGYKGHISIDPDSEIITATKVTAGNTSDGAVAEELLEEALPPKTETTQEMRSESTITAESTNKNDSEAVVKITAENSVSGSDQTCADVSVEAYGDAAYGTADNLKKLNRPGVVLNLKVPGPSTRKGQFSKDEFDIDLDNGTVTCPKGEQVKTRVAKNGSSTAEFGSACSNCLLRSQCTESKSGRTIRLHPDERLLSNERERQKDENWRADYRATRPKVERKIGHLVFRRHGGRRSRVRGTERVGHDFSLLAAVVNLKRLAMLGIPVSQPLLAF